MRFIDEATGEYIGREVWQKLHRGGGGGASTRLGGTRPPQSVCNATASWAQLYAPKGGRPTKRGAEVVVAQSEVAPPPSLRVRPRPPPPKPSKVAKVAAQPPPPALDVGALAATVATRVTDACQTLVEQAAVTGMEAAVARGRAADHKSALAKAGKVQGNSQRALDRALNLANKSGEELVAVRGDLKEAHKGRQKAEVEAAHLRVEVEAMRRRGDDLQHRLGVEEAHMRSLTSTLSATYTAQHRVGPPGVQSQSSGSRSGSQ